MFDVIIIGAGPAGAAAAFDLLSSGASVLVLDKTDFPRKKACAGGITPKAFHLFKYDITPLIQRACHRVRVRKKNGDLFDITGADPLCFMTRREELDEYCLKKVVQMGAQFKIAKKIRNITETEGGIQVDTDIGRFAASYLIGADGSNSRVRRLTHPPGFWQHQMAIEADVYVDRPDRFDMEFDFCGIDQGYQWIFPKKDHVNVGLYTTGNNPGLTVKRLSDYVQRRLGAYPMRAVKGYPICTGGYRYCPGNHRVILAGDAAGLAEKLLGEGIYFAVKSGQLAANAVSAGLNDIGVNVSDIYHNDLAGIRNDLRIYQYSSAFFYRMPVLSLNLLSVPFLHQPFSKGFAEGKTLSQIFCRK